MNKIIFSLLFSCLIFQGFLYSQGLIVSKEDSLQIYLDKKDLRSYLKVFEGLRDTAFNHKDRNALLNYSKMLQQDYGELDASQRFMLRRVRIVTGQKVWRLTGSIEEALAIYLKAHELVENKITLDTLAWYAENEIMNLYTRKGDYDRAAYYSAMVKYSLEYHQKYNLLSRYYANLGRKLNSESKVDEAIETLRKGFVLADSMGYPLGIFGNAINLAEIYNNLQKIDSAEKYIKISDEYLPLTKKASRYKEKESNFKMESARLNSLQGKHLESIPLYKEAIEVLREFYPDDYRREFAKYYNLLAIAYFNIDSLDEANSTIIQGLASLIPEFKKKDEFPKSTQLYAENSFIDLLELKGGIYEKEYSMYSDKASLEKALTSYDLALYVNELIRESVIADPSKLVSIRSNKALIGKGVSILYQLNRLDNTSDNWERTRSLFNRSKAILYSEKSRKNNLIDVISAEDREKWKVLQKKLEDLYERKFDDSADINVINGEIISCMQQMQNIFSAYDSVILNTRVPDNYVEYFISDENIYSLSVLNGQKKFLNLGSQHDFQRLSSRLNEYILMKGMSLDENILREMYNFIIKPIDSQLPENIVIIPDGTIGYVPFEMLRDEAGDYLIKNTSISYSFEYITYAEDSIKHAASLDIYCLAPQYKSKEVKNDVTRGSVYALPYAKIEVDSIKSLYGSAAMVSQSVDKVEWQHNITKSKIFHYAGHAIIEMDKAFLALTDSDDEKEQLTSKEIGLMHHPLDLVVLSACETGLGTLEQGEGIRSLGRSFMESGAKSTIISLWNVNDKSTARIMTSFYKYLRSGMNKDMALRQAKLDYIKNTSARNAHPYFWAAFIPAGDMNPLK